MSPALPIRPIFRRLRARSQTVAGGNGDAFVSKLDPAGSALVYSTYLGGSEGGVVGELGLAIALDASGNAYVTGETRSTDFPITVDAFQSNSLSDDAFITRLNASGSALLYSTYLGGVGEDFGFGIAVDAAGSAYVTGQTSAGGTPSPNFPITPGAFQTAFAGVIDAFVAKFGFLTSFASSSAKLQITGGPPPGGFHLKEFFTLGAGNNGINPLNEAVSLQIGTFSLTIPAGSFTAFPHARFMFHGVIGDVSLNAQIVPVGCHSFLLKIAGTGVDLSSLTNPAVMLTIGDDTGSTTVTAHLE